ncbi:MAG: DUF423 domain-containing protein [Anaerolineales bacterium]
MTLFFALGSFLGGLAVILGAFGAHGLADRLTPDRLANFEIAVRYQIYHSLALLAVALALAYFPAPAKYLQIGGWLFFAGILLFSGSLYVLSITGISWLGAVTPFGGVAFALGWLMLLLAAWQAR